MNMILIIVLQRKMAHQAIEMGEIYEDVEDSDEAIYDDVKGPNEQHNAEENVEEYLDPERHPQLSNRGDFLHESREKGEKKTKGRKTKNILIAVLSFQFVLLLGTISGTVFAFLKGK